MQFPHVCACSKTLQDDFARKGGREEEREEESVQAQELARRGWRRETAVLVRGAVDRPSRRREPRAYNVLNLVFIE